MLVLNGVNVDYFGDRMGTMLLMEPLFFIFILFYFACDNGEPMQWFLFPLRLSFFLFLYPCICNGAANELFL